MERKPVSAELYSLIQLLMQDPLLEPFYLVGSIKVELISHQYPLLREIEVKDEIRLAKL